MSVPKPLIDSYLSDIHEEFRKRGVSEADMSKVIAKTGFMAALNEYPEVQLHYPIKDTVDEIILTAALN